MIPFSAVIFDLDGTLLDTAPDVVGLLSQVVREHGVSDAGIVSATVVGPPLTESVPKACPGVPAEITSQIVEEYRLRYTASDYSLTRVFPGIFDLMDGLKAAGIPLFVATNKTVDATERVLRQFDIWPRLTASISYDQFPGQSMDKAAMIRTLLTQYRLDPASTVMVGDTELDILGGHGAGVQTLAAFYGYGSHETLLAAKPHYITHNPDWRGNLVAVAN